MFDYPTIAGFQFKFWSMAQLLGFRPYEVANENKTPKYKTARNLIVIYMVISYAQYLRYQRIRNNDLLSKYSLIIQYSFLSGTTFMSSIYFLYNHNLYMDYLNKITCADHMLRQLHVKISYRRWFLSIMVAVAISPLNVYITFSSKVELYERFLNFIGYGVPIMIRFSIILHPTLSIGIVWEKLSCLNRILEDYPLERGGCDKLYLNRSPMYMIHTAMELHEVLSEAVRLLEKTFSAIMLLNVVMSYVQFIFATFFLFFGHTDELTSSELYGATGAFTLQMVALYLFGHLVETEAKNIMVTVANISLNETLTQKKNGWLLQHLQSNFTLSVAGLFPVNLSILIKQFEFCNVIIILLISYQYA